MGVLIALSLAGVASRHDISPKLLLLWPLSILGLAEPSTLSGSVILTMVEFGGNFVLYGIVGTFIGWGFRRRAA